MVEWDKQKAAQANRPAYVDSNPKKLEALYTDIKRKYQAKDIRNEMTVKYDTRYRYNTFDEMPGCIGYEVALVGTYDNKVAEIIRDSDFDKATNQVKTNITQDLYSTGRINTFCRTGSQVLSIDAHVDVNITRT